MEIVFSKRIQTHVVAGIRLLLAVAVNANVNEYENGREIRQPIVSARFQSKKKIVE